ncbi:MAG TPA: hypothetical protein PKK10_13955 [Woeseiaceae bacterium]|nr:hypothetical protein [Woeseiaceae bacterium]
MKEQSAESGQAQDSRTERWWLVRDTAVLQVKLMVDGVRDLVLVPSSIIAAFISLLTGRNGRPGPQFERLMDWGKRSERWIDLFGTHGNATAANADEGNDADGNIDSLVRRMESFVVDEYQRGGLTRQAKERIDKALDALQSKRDPR